MQLSKLTGHKSTTLSYFYSFHSHDFMLYSHSFWFSLILCYLPLAVASFYFSFPSFCKISQALFVPPLYLYNDNDDEEAIILTVILCCATPAVEIWWPTILPPPFLEKSFVICLDQGTTSPIFFVIFFGHSISNNVVNNMWYVSIHTRTILLSSYPSPPTALPNRSAALLSLKESSVMPVRIVQYSTYPCTLTLPHDVVVNVEHNTCHPLSLSSSENSFRPSHCW